MRRTELDEASTAHAHNAKAIIGEPEVVEDVATGSASASTVEDSAAWLALKDAATALQSLQVKDGSVPESSDHEAAREHVATIIASIRLLAPLLSTARAWRVLDILVGATMLVIAVKLAIG